MDDQTLQLLVEKISIEFFDRSFQHRAYFNRNLRTTGGRYHLNTHNIDFNCKILEYYDEEELIRVIKHELCHYHLHLAGKGYRHKDKEFKLLLQHTGGSRYVQSLADPASIKGRTYQCSNCKCYIFRKRRIDTAKYVCGKCHGKLVETDSN